MNKYSKIGKRQRAKEIMKKFDYSIAERSESVVIVGAGPSSTANMEKIIDYAEQNGSVTIVPNYSYHGLKSDYVYFTDKITFAKYMPKMTRNQRIIICQILTHLAKPWLKDHTFYKVGKHGKPVVYNADKIKMSSNGEFPYMSLGTAGFACVLLSVLFKPKRILLAGFDGPSDDYSYKIRLGEKIKYKRPAKSTKMRESYFVKRLLPFVLSRGIEIDSFKGDRLWKANKNQLGINELN